GLVDVWAAAWTGAAGALTTALGALATRHVSGHLVMLVTAVILLVLGVRALAPEDPGAGDVQPRRTRGALLALGGVAGFFSGLLGIGGGFLLVPAYIHFFHFPVKVALGTSLAVITLTVLPNIVAHAYVGNIDWPIAALLTLGVVPGARLGAALAVRAPERILRTVVALGVVAVALAYAGLELAELFCPECR
ncbi:MAG: sulfite exporter TauE/SafE family protein, partial [Actinomycetota bacterium]